MLVDVLGVRIPPTHRFGHPLVGRRVLGVSPEGEHLDTNSALSGADGH